MARGSFLIKGGKGKIGVGARQITPDEIIPMYKDYTEELYEIKHEIDEIGIVSNSNAAKLYYDRVPVLVVDKEEFSNATYFNPNPYIILKNANDEFFFGVDSSKPNSRFDPRGTVIKLDIGRLNLLFSRIPPTFYCLADDLPVYTSSRVTFYKIFPTSPNFINYNYSASLFYDFTIVREGIPKINADSSDLKLVDVTTSKSFIADEIKAEVKNEILFLTVKNAKTSTLGTELVDNLICKLPFNYRPSRSVNVSFINALGETFMGTLDKDGSVSINFKGRIEEGVYLHTSIPVLDTSNIL